MPTPADFEKGTFKRRFKILTIGGSGSGKTHFCSGFPKSFFLITEPGGEDTFLSNKNLLKNIVRWEYLIPSDPENTKEIFNKLEEYCKKIRSLIEAGEVETVVLDNLTYLADNYFIYINHHLKKQIMSSSGEIDTRSAYGKLGRWLYQFVLFNLLSMPCNVIVTCHEQLENEEAMAKKVDKNNPVVPNILGGFRNEAEGMFSVVLYLNKIEDKANKGEYKYLARANKGGGRNAKNRINLPPVIENVSYEQILKYANKGE